MGFAFKKLSVENGHRKNLREHTICLSWYITSPPMSFKRQDFEFKTIRTGIPLHSPWAHYGCPLSLNPDLLERFSSNSHRICKCLQSMLPQPHLGWYIFFPPRNKMLEETLQGSSWMFVCGLPFFDHCGTSNLRNINKLLRLHWFILDLIWLIPRLSWST